MCGRRHQRRVPTEVIDTLVGIVVFSSQGDKPYTVTQVSETLNRLAPSEQSFLGYLFWLSRPRFWLYLAGPVVVGVVYGSDAVGSFVQPVTVAMFLYFLLPANVYLYGVNDIFDADIDEQPEEV